MLDRQILKDQQGVPMGVFIPIQSWNNLLIHYPEIEVLDSDLPRWEKDLIDNRLGIAQHYSERLKPVEMLLDTL